MHNILHGRAEDMADRTFDVLAYRYYNQSLAVEHSNARWSCLACPHYLCDAELYHNDAIVIATPGIARTVVPAAGEAQAAYAIFFDPDSEHNQVTTYGENEVKVGHKQRMELLACCAALETVRRIEASPSSIRLRRVIIKTDSEMLAEAMTEHIYAWQASDYRDAWRHQVADAEFFQHIDSLVQELNRRSIWIQFWLVREDEENRAARHAAYLASIGAPTEEITRAFGCVAVPRSEST